MGSKQIKIFQIVGLSFIMLKFIIYSLFIINSSALSQKYGFIKPLQPSKNISINLIDKWLQKPLKHLPYNYQIVVPFPRVFGDMDNPYIRWFLQQPKLTVTLSTYGYLPNSLPPEIDGNYYRKNYVILTEIDLLEKTAKRFAQKAGTYFFIVNGVDTGSWMNSLHDFFYYMWNTSMVYNNYLLTEAGVFTYDPFSVNVNGEYGQIINYDGVHSIDHALFRNMHGYPLRVQMFKSVYSQPIKDEQNTSLKRFKGVDSKVAFLLQHYLNFTMILQDPDPNYFGSRLPNGSFNGAIGSAINHQLDICMTGFFVKNYLTSEISFSAAVYDDKVCIYTKKAQRIPKSILPFFSVQCSVWICFISMAFLCTIMWTTLRILNLRLDIYGKTLGRNFGQQYVNILINTWLAWVRNTALKYPPFVNERIFVASLCLSSVIFGAIFECSLSAVFINPLYFNDINSLQQLDDKDLEILYKHRSMADDLFFSDTSKLFNSLNRKLVYLNSNTILNEVDQNSNVAGVSRYKTLTLQSLNSIVNKRIWIIPECPKYYAISYIWPVGVPWEDAINKMLLRFLSSGLILKFEREMKTEVDIKIMKEHMYENHRHFRVLTMSDLQLGFYIIIAGHLASLFSFIGEIFKVIILRTKQTQLN